MFGRAEGVMLLDPDPAKAAGGGGGGETAEQKAARENTERLQRAQSQSGDAVVQEIERQRVAAIENLGKTNNLSSDIVRTMVSKGMNMEEVSQTILKIHEERGKHKPPSRAFLDLSDGDVKDYSIVRAINAQVENRWMEDAPFELECSREVAKRLNKIPAHNRFFVPLDIQRRHAPVDVDRLAARIGLSDRDAIAHLRRDLNVATTTQGGFLTQTSIISFDELLRNISFAYRMGVRRLSGLRDTVAIPRQSAAATAVWLANETSTITESTPAFVQLLMAPKQVGAYTEISRQLLMQSVIAVESFLQQDLAAVVGLAVDAAVLNGSGASGQPTGLDNTSGVGSVTGTTLAFDDILEFQTDVAAGNVRPVRGGYVTTPAVASLCIQRVKYASTASPLWEGNIWEGQMQGFPAMSTNQVAAATMYFGDWDKAVVGEWGVLEIETNPFANFQAAIIGVRAIYSIDVGIRYPVAFSRAGTIT
jgi:HK97 family phage major capsid protein